MQRHLPDAVIAAATAGELYADAHQVLYTTKCGSLDLNHAIVDEDGGIRISMNIVDRAQDSMEISNRCLSEIITQDQAFQVIERWSLMHRFEQGLDIQEAERAESKFKM